MYQSQQAVYYGLLILVQNFSAYIMIVVDFFYLSETICVLSLPSLRLINTNLSWNAVTVNWGESDFVTNAYFVSLSLNSSL